MGSPGAVIDGRVGRSLDEAFIRRRVGRFAIHCSALSASLVSRVWGTIFGAAAKGTTAPYLKRFSAALPRRRARRTQRRSAAPGLISRIESPLDKDLLLDLKEFTVRPMDRAMTIDPEAAAA